MFRHRHETSHGEEVARLYREHATAVYRFAYHLTGSREDAEDLLQAAFLEAHRRLQAGEQLVNPAAWLTTVAKHRAFKLHRDRREVPLLDETLASLPAAEQSDAEAELRRVRAVLFSLPEAQHQAFVLRHWSGLSVREVAVVMETTEKAVESLLVRARSAVLAERELASTCMTVREQLAAGHTAPLHEAHLQGCSSCRRAQQRLARIAGVAAAVALVPRLHAAQALAASIPGFTVAGAGAASGTAAAAATGTGKVAGAKVLAAVLAITVATGTAAHVVRTHRAGPDHHHANATISAPTSDPEPQHHGHDVTADTAEGGQTDAGAPASGAGHPTKTDRDGQDAAGNADGTSNDQGAGSAAGDDQGGDPNSQSDQGSPTPGDDQGTNSKPSADDSGNTSGSGSPSTDQQQSDGSN